MQILVSTILVLIKFGLGTYRFKFLEKMQVVFKIRRILASKLSKICLYK